METLPTNVTNEAWGSEGVEKSDLLLPRLTLMHDLSDLVKKKKADSGDLVNTSTSEVLWRTGEPGLEIIPISTFKEWQEFEVVGKKEVFLTSYPFTEENANFSKEDMVNGKAIRRIRALNFFVLLPSKFDEFPFMLSLKKSNYFSGRQLSTHFQISAMKKLPPAAKVFSISSQDKTWEGNTFKIFSLEVKRDATSDELATARLWYDTFNKSKVKVEDDFNPDTL